MSMNPRHEQHPPPSHSWEERLGVCETETDILEACRDFLAQFSPYEIVALPEVCRPPRLKDGGDISDYAFTLVRHHCDHGEPHDYAVHRLVRFFSSASSRLSQILRHRPFSTNDGAEGEPA